MSDKRELLSWTSVNDPVGFTNHDDKRGELIMKEDREKLRAFLKEKEAAEVQLRQAEREKEKEEFTRRQKERENREKKYAEHYKQVFNASSTYYAGIGHAADGTPGMFVPSTNHSPGGFRDSYTSPGGTRRLSHVSSGGLIPGENEDNDKKGKEGFNSPAMRRAGAAEKSKESPK